MSLFGKILSKLGMGKDAAKPAATPAAPAAASHPTASPAAAAAVANNPGAVANAASIAVVDVVGQLEVMAKANPQKLNWKTSIVDLLKLLDIDSSYAARKELAAELGCPADLMGDSAKMNIWLHKTVLQKLADNGGNVPSSLLG